MTCFIVKVWLLGLVPEVEGLSSQRDTIECSSEALIDQEQALRLATTASDSKGEMA